MCQNDLSVQVRVGRGKKKEVWKSCFARKVGLTYGEQQPLWPQDEIAGLQ